MHRSELKSASVADGLLPLVSAGKKAAICRPASWGPVTNVGNRMAVLDSERRPRAATENTALAECPFEQVGWDFARLEGDNDDLAGGRRVHEDLLTANGGFSPDMMMCREQFRLIETLPEIAR